jgi:hypothetical protein
MLVELRRRKQDGGIPTDCAGRLLGRTGKPFQNKPPTNAGLSACLEVNPDPWAAITGRISGRLTPDFDGTPRRQTLSRDPL